MTRALLDTPVRVAQTAFPRHHSRSHSLPAIVLAAALLLLTLFGGAVRLQAGLGADGKLDEDETRLALAADGVRQTGLPIMPSGRLYTRGLLNSYLMAGAYGLVGRGDLGARLPSALAGALLIPLVFLFGRAVARPLVVRSPVLANLAGLAAAAFVALAQPIVDVGRNAWMPGLFLLTFTLAAYACYRGFVDRHAGWQLAGAGLFLLALLSYEFAVLLLVGLAIHLLVRLAFGDWDWYRGRPTVLALVLLSGGLALFIALALALRSGTLAGSLGEVQAFVAPALRLEGASYYYRNLLADYLPWLGAALLGLALLAWKSPSAAVFLGSLTLLAFLVPSFLLQSQYQVRYAAPLLPLVAILAAAGLVGLADLVLHQARVPDSRNHLNLPCPPDPHQSEPAVARGLVPRTVPTETQGLSRDTHGVRRQTGLLSQRRFALGATLLLLLLAPTLQPDLATALRRLRQSPGEQNWVQVIRQQGLQPSDLLVVERPEAVFFYLGRADYYVRSEGFERYTYLDDGEIRYLYTGALLLAERGDWERLVGTANPGQTVWIVSRGEKVERRLREIDPRLWSTLSRSATLRHETRDDWTFLRTTLPLRP